MMIYRLGPVNKADGSHEKPPAAGFVENLALGHEASSNPSWEPLSHELAKWYLLQAHSAHAPLQVVVQSATGRAAGAYSTLDLESDANECES
jgi:hypothetical protein